MNHIGDMENIGADHNTPLDTMVMIKKSETTDLMDYEVTGHQGPGGYNFESNNLTKDSSKLFNPT